uniref:histone-lysine N-methyltransferase 2E n=1 Tax=Monopterus albus TaxID=43700 RepID=UPI0009B3D846|nr:histone-lysine N-methyltransferase 2E-like [Monopterus albus]
MFSDSRASEPGEQRGFKPHTPNFIPWLRNSLKPNHSSDLGLSGPYKSSSEAPTTLPTLERTKGIGFFSIQGKDRVKKGELRFNGVGMARMLPVVLRGHHILPGSLRKQREDRWSQSPEQDTDPTTQTSPGNGPQGLVNSSASAQDNHSFVRTHNSHLSLLQSQNDRTSTPVRKYGTLVGPHPVPAPTLLTEEPNCKVPVVVCLEDRRGKVWDYTSHTTYHQSDPHSSSWLSSDTQGLIERHHDFSYIRQQSRNSQSQRDLTALGEPPVELFNGPLNGGIFSTEVPQRGCITTPQDPGEPRPSSGRNREGESQRKEADCSRMVVRNQIKRVVDNLEHVLTALWDIHQEMKEVVQQIDHLTLSIDLNEEPGGDDGTKPPSDSSSSSGSSSSEVMVGSTHQRPSELEDHPGTTDSTGSIRKYHPSRSQSPPSGQLHPVTSGLSSERIQTLQFTCNHGSSPTQEGQLPYNNVPSSNPQQTLTSHECTLSLRRNLPVPPPTPGLSPLTVNLHPPSSPGSQLHSPASSSFIKVNAVLPPSLLSPDPHPPLALSPSVIIETKVGSYQTPQSDHPSANLLSASSTQPLSTSCPPPDSETQTVSSDDRGRQASSAGSVHRPPQVCTVTAATAKPQGRRGRKPPPYPHHKLSEHTKKGKEPRKAPPYPEKRRLLSTTV